MIRCRWISGKSVQSLKVFMSNNAGLLWRLKDSFKRILSDAAENRHHLLFLPQSMTWHSPTCMIKQRASGRKDRYARISGLADICERPHYEQCTASRDWPAPQGQHVPSVLYNNISSEIPEPHNHLSTFLYPVDIFIIYNKWWRKNQPGINDTANQKKWRNRFVL